MVLQIYILIEFFQSQFLINMLLLLPHKITDLTTKINSEYHLDFYSVSARNVLHAWGKCYKLSFGVIFCEPSVRMNQGVGHFVHMDFQCLGKDGKALFLLKSRCFSGK
jgi:hypothetical protein